MQKAKTFQDISIGNFVFTIWPVTAQFNNSTEYRHRLSLEKGMQTLGTVQQQLPIIHKHQPMVHKFDPQSNTISFRVTSDKNLNYQWTIYKLLDGGEMEEIQAVQFSILNFWKNFAKEYEKQLSELNLRTKEDKEGKKTIEIWQQLSEQSQGKEAALRVLFKKTNFQFDFMIQGKGSLDQQAEDYERERMLKRLRQIQKSQIRKSNLSATYLGPSQNDKIEEANIIEKLKRSKTDVQKIMNAQKGAKVNFLSPNKQNNGEMKKSASNNELNILSRQITIDQGHQSLQISSHMVPTTSMKKLSSYDRRQSVNQAQRDQALQLSSKIKHHNSQKLKLDYSSDSSKTVAFYIILAIVGLFLIYSLMHHTSKVEYRQK